MELSSRAAACCGYFGCQTMKIGLIVSLNEVARRVPMKDFLERRGYAHPIWLGDLLYGWFLRSLAQPGLHAFWRV